MDEVAAPEPEPSGGDREFEGIEGEFQFLTQGFFVVSCVVAAGITHHVDRGWLQESMVYIILGGLLGALVLAGEEFAGDNSDAAREIFKDYFSFDAQQFFFLLLPPIILDAGYNIPRKKNFFKNLSSILAFAFVGTFISTLIIGSGLWLASTAVCPTDEACGGDGQPVSLGFERPAIAFKLGAMLSATDPVATLSVLSSLGGLTDPNLHNIIFGESIFNDAVAIVLFEVFDAVAKEADAGGEQRSSGAQILQAVGQFVYITVLSCAMGVAIGIIAALLTRWWWVRGLAHVEVILLTGLAYTSYVVAETADISGIMSLFVCAMTLSHYARHNITREAAQVTTYGFHSLSFVAEAAVFTFMGGDFVLSDFGGRLGDGGEWDWRLIVLTVPVVLLSRCFSVFGVSAVINCAKQKGRDGRVKNGLSFRSQLVLWWAGLRGAIAYGLAKRWDAEENSPLGQVTTTIVVVMFTTFVFGSTIGGVISCLGLAGHPADDMDSDDEALETDEQEEEIVRQRRLSSHSMKRPTRTPIERQIAAGTATPLDEPLLGSAVEGGGDGDAFTIGGGGSSRRGGSRSGGLMAWCRRQDREVLSKWLGGKHWRLQRAVEQEVERKQHALVAAQAAAATEAVPIPLSAGNDASPPGPGGSE